MKHRIKAKHFNRDTQSRKALFRNSLRGLIEHGQIETSEGRAKELRRLADKLINRAQKGDLASRREIHKFFGKRDVVNTLFEQVVPAMGDRKSGFCSLEKLSNRRGDNMIVYRLSLLVDEKKWKSLKNETKKVEKEKQKTGKKPSIKKKTKTPVKKVTKKETNKSAAKKKEDKN
jgi:large subunit ribosomal protein L17